MELVDETLDRGAFEPESELTDALAKELPDIGRGLLEAGHGARMLAAGRAGLKPPRVSGQALAKRPLGRVRLLRPIIECVTHPPEYW